MRYSVFAAVLMSQLALAADVEERLNVSDSGLVKIENLRGEVSVEAWDESIVHIEGELDELAEGLRFESHGDVTVIEVLMPGQDVNWGDASDLTIYVPRQSRVSVEAVSADIEVDGVAGGLKLRTISGEIDVDGSQKRIHLNTVSGEIEVKNSNGSLNAKSASGEITVQDHIGEVDVESLSGDVYVEATNVSRLRASTVSGELEVDVTFSKNVIADLSSVSGSVSLKVASPQDFVLKASSNSGGIDNDLSKDKIVEQYGMKSIDVRLGNGRGDVHIRTVSGSIDLEEG